MNKRQAKKKRKKEQAEYYAALEQLPEIAQRISEGIKEALDKINEALSQIDLTETLIRLKKTIEQYAEEEQDGAQN